MPNLANIEKRIFRVEGADDFNDLAIEIFYFQFENNKIYHDFVSRLIGKKPVVKHFSQVPFLPIEFYKTHKVVSGKFDADQVFTSSGTSGMQTSSHFVKSSAVYETSFLKAFESFFGKPEEYVILALLPAYLERKGSSLIYMAEHLIRKSNFSESGFYLDEYQKLSTLLKVLKREKKKVILLGVTFALLDLAERFPIGFPELIVMETGGMKGRRKELLRQEVHTILQDAFSVKQIYSEYGMTELLSQAYSTGIGVFETPSWMKILIRDPNDPLSYLQKNKTGGINVIDLANLYSCSFIATQDLGKLNETGNFEVLGRFDSSDVRGCNLMVV
jgi:hypothetical protein